MLTDLIYAAGIVLLQFFEKNYMAVCALYLLACLPAFVYWFFREWLPDAKEYIRNRETWR